MINDTKVIITDKTYLIFDLDGTIIDTDKANFLSYQEAVKKVKNMELKSLYKGNERFTREKLNLIIPNLTIKEYEKIIKIKTDAFDKYLKNTKSNNAILEIIKQFSQTNKIILATNSHAIKANLLLKYYNLFNIFDKKYYQESYLKSKDNKYQYILNDLNVTPSNVIIFEDNHNEIDKAINLGIPSENIINPIIKGDKNYE